MSKWRRSRSVRHHYRAAVLDGMQASDTPKIIGLRLGNGKYCTLRLFVVLADINRS